MKFFKKYRTHFIYQLASMIFLILVFMLGAYILIIRYSAGLMRQNTLDMNKKLLAQAEKHIQEYWDSLYNIATSFCYSPTTSQYLSGDPFNRPQGDEELSLVFDNILLLDSHILSAYLYNESLTQIAAMGKEFSISEDDFILPPPFLQKYA